MEATSRSTPYDGLINALRTVPEYLLQPARLVRAYDRNNLRPDLIAGLTVAIVGLPQAIVFALLAGLPPQMGVYTAIVGGTVGALWGSSRQLSTGPSNSSSLLVLSILVTVANPGTPLYIAAAGVLAVMAGLLRVVMGMARLGVLVQFVSDSVIVGFTAGAGTLIVISELRHFLGLNVERASTALSTLQATLFATPTTHLPSLLVALGTLLIIVVLRRVNRNLPGALIAMVAAALVVAVLNLQSYGVHVLDPLPRSLPPLTRLPLLDLGLVGELSTGALAVAAIGLVEAVAISRSIATQTGQRLDSNQEFVGQGLANIASGFFSGYPCSGSFNRSALNYEAGAKSQFASVVSSLFVAIAVLLLAPFAAYIPRGALAAVLFVTAVGMIDRKEMARIMRGARGDALIMIVTLSATLLLPLQFAVLTGILMSLVYYIWRTSLPRVFSVVPDEDYKHMVRQVDRSQGVSRPACPQLGILEIQGDLYFGAAQNVEDAVLRNMERNPDQRFLLLRMLSVAQIDISGVHMLEHVLRTYRDRGGDLFLVRVQRPVYQFMVSTGFVDQLGKDHFLHEDEALSHLFYRVLDPATCIYECELRVFKECQNLPKQSLPEPVELPRSLATPPCERVAPRALWEQLRGENPPLVVDVREPREFQRAHIPAAQSLPLPQILTRPVDLPHDRPIVLACRTGRRSARAVQLLALQGFPDLRILDGGLVAWEAAGLLEAVDLNIPEGR